MSLSLLLQQCPTCLVWMVLEMGGRWPCSSCFEGYCFQDLFNIACSIRVQILSSCFPLYAVCIHTVELTQPLGQEKKISFYRIRLTFT